MSPRASGPRPSAVGSGVDVDVGAVGRGGPSGDSKPRILLVAPQPFFEDRGTPIALRYVLQAYTELGCEVDMLTLPLGKPIDIPGVRFLRVANPLRIRSIRIGFSLRKLFFDLLIWRALRRQLRRETYAFIHAVEEAVFLATTSASSKRVPIVYDMASLLTDELEHHPVLGLSPLQALFRRFENRMLRSVDSVVCSAGLEGHVASVSPGTPCWRWIFPSSLSPVDTESVEALRRELDIPADAQVVAYVGSFAEYQGVGMLLDAVPTVAHAMPRAFFVVVGASSDAHAARLLEGLPSEARARTRILARVPKDRVASFLTLADVLVSLRMRGRNAPLKIFDYMAMGRAMVATDIPAHRAVLDESLAVLVQPRADALADGIVELLRDVALRERLVGAALVYAHDALTWPSFVARIRSIAEGTLREAQAGQPAPGFGR